MTDSLSRLYNAVHDAKTRDPASSRTARLTREGVAKMAKKLVEEAAEVGLDAVQGDRGQIVNESADLLYHLVVLWAETGVAPDDVWKEMDRREQLFGIAEKLPKVGDKGRRPLAVSERSRRSLRRDG
ncbi:phosphoribosyl-ATP diphosphatase [Chelatococcus sp. SYSU_G07232]|uniref:Phosphoribosyl-ATP pyrophosphatase n=1 Tax=Chelatococcus albus TaxID=3047466 RepID=A0ABT7ADU3_9HYPH|nr:phosphoribosyl-ATP diphosphatase [Chelatococcus sp. SYSU_G07232]MDJ1157544.1 phosphoribosyl-ATP diphosphatase [Chelatococcus sp. SYSU_G07232]